MEKSKTFFDEIFESYYAFVIFKFIFCFSLTKDQCSKVRLYYPYWQYTDLFIFRFVLSLLFPQARKMKGQKDDVHLRQVYKMLLKCILPKTRERNRKMRANQKRNQSRTSIQERKRFPSLMLQMFSISMLLLLSKKKPPKVLC